MKKNIYILFGLLTAFVLSGCYSDKGSYDYSNLDDVAITLPATSYDVAVGESLKINPTITTEISESDLTYQWELYGANPNGKYNCFTKFATGKDLGYSCKISDLMPALKAYNIRLHIIQNSTKRDFYSDVATLNLSGITGLMVLHGDGSKCDIGFLRSTDFLLSTGNRDTDNQPNWYSNNNENAKIDGVGKSIVQSLLTNQITSYGTSSYADVVAITDKGAKVCNYAALNKKGDWGCMFLISDACKGKPQSYLVGDQNAYAIDNGELFVRTASGNALLFQVANISNNIAYVQAYVPRNNNAFFFDKNKRAFYAIPWPRSDMNDSQLTEEGGWNQMFEVETLNGNFNMADMQASLLDLETGGTAGHYMAVMQKDDGSKYLAEINPTASSTSQWDYAKYDMSSLPDIGNAKFYSFGESAINMCYYATASAVYNFAANVGSGLSASKLTDESGNMIDFGGAEITMMKVLKPVMGDKSYYNYNKILLVGTYAGSTGTGKLYSLKINQVTGLVTGQTIYSGFDRIYDASMKGI